MLLVLLSILVLCRETFSQIQKPIQTLMTVGNPREFRASESLDTCFLTPPSCDASYKYRTFDGSCNNPVHPTWGMTNSVFTRLFPARYRDGIELPPTAVDGSELPDARLLVTSLLVDDDHPDIVPLSVAQWAQFTAHDLGLPLFKTEVADCCASKDPLYCMSIDVPPGDKFYSQFNVTCLPVIRTQTTVTGNCEANGTKHQINGISHAMDASQIYGSDPQGADSIREHSGGRLTVRESSQQRWFLPTSGPTNACYNSKTCYVGGSTRVNQTPQLTVLTTLFVREHNRIARELYRLHPNWDDEILYQETRRLIIAIYQHIGYHLWLPNILPSRLLTTDATYDSRIPMMGIMSFLNPTMRLFHSALQGHISFFDYHLNPTKQVNLSDYMNSPGIIEDDDNFDELILGLLNQPMQKIDEYYTSEIQGKVYHYAQPYGSDLNALDVQRTRDLAIPAYTSILYACRAVEVKSFEDLLTIWPEAKVYRIRELYKSVHDIDLFIGLVSETKDPGERLSPLAQCIMAEQFYRYKHGDRFWYEVQGHSHSFTTTQLAEIKKYTLGHIICYNSDKIVNVPTNVFAGSSDTNNPVVSCTDLDLPDLSKF